MKSSKQNKNTHRGFTLVELLVTIGIFVFMSALILSRYNSYNSGTLLTNAAYDVALAVKEAQTYGIGVKNSESESNQFSTGYGLFFATDSGDASHSPNTDSFVLFADKFDSFGKSDHVCNKTGGGVATSISECVNGPEFIKKYSLKNTIKIDKICGVLSEDVWPTGTTDTRREDCNTVQPYSANLIRTVSLVFTRPNPDATISAMTDVGITGVTYKGARIYLKSLVGPDGEIAELARNGQLSVRQSASLSAPVGPVDFTITFTSPSMSVAYGDKPVLNWSTNYLSVCTGMQNFTITPDPLNPYSTRNGSAYADNPQNTGGDTVNYTIGCTKSDGEYKDKTIGIYTEYPQPLNVTIDASPNPAEYGTTPSITWNAGVSSSSGYNCYPDPLSPSLFDTGGFPVSIAPATSKVQIWDNPVTYKVSCTGPSGVTPQSASIPVVPMGTPSSSSGGESISITKPYNGQTISLLSFNNLPGSLEYSHSAGIRSSYEQIFYGTGLSCARSINFFTSPSPEESGMLCGNSGTGEVHIRVYGCTTTGTCDENSALVSSEVVFSFTN